MTPLAVRVTMVIVVTAGVAAAYVLSSSHGFEVLRVHTRSIAAEVVNVQAFRDRTDEELVGHPVRAEGSLRAIAAEAEADREDAISA